MDDYEKLYKEALERARQFSEHPLQEDSSGIVEYIFPELKESDDERIRKEILDYIDKSTGCKRWVDWIEKQGGEPDWCHHKVDLSACSEEYRKAYYDGWNNCNMQHSQCNVEKNDVIKCLINGMRFYYEDNENATWGTDKWSMPVKHIIDVLEKQGEQKPQRMISAEAIQQAYME